MLMVCLVKQVHPKGANFTRWPLWSGSKDFSLEKGDDYQEGMVAIFAMGPQDHHALGQADRMVITPLLKTPHNTEA